MDLISVISLVLSILAIILTVSFRINDTFNSSKQKYLEDLEKLYLEFLKVYSSKDREVEVKKFVEKIFEDNINTSHFGRFHYYLLNDRKSGLYNFETFMYFAQDVEERYWLEYKGKYLYKLKNLKPLDSYTDTHAGKVYYLLTKLNFIERNSIIIIIICIVMFSYAIFDSIANDENNILQIITLIFIMIFVTLFNLIISNLKNYFFRKQLKVIFHEGDINLPEQYIRNINKDIREREAQNKKTE